MCPRLGAATVRGSTTGSAPPRGSVHGSCPPTRDIEHSAPQLQEVVNEESAAVMAFDYPSDTAGESL